MTETTGCVLVAFWLLVGIGSGVPAVLIALDNLECKRARQKIKKGDK